MTKLLQIRDKRLSARIYSLCHSFLEVASSKFASKTGRWIGKRTAYVVSPGRAGCKAQGLTAWLDAGSAAGQICKFIELGAFDGASRQPGAIDCGQTERATAIAGEQDGLRVERPHRR
jgi:hypothetical protein